METEWVMARVQLYQLMRQQPTWSLARLAETLGYSLSWVKKWRQRFRSTTPVTWQTFLSQSRAPKTRRQRVTKPVVEAVQALRDELKEVYQRTVGAKTILFHLHQDYAARAPVNGLPRSVRTLWQILRVSGRIPQRRHEHHPLPRAEPMQEWEADFGLVKPSETLGVEFLVLVDSGTSILVDTQATEGFQAESALAALARTLLLNGLPRRLRIDRDARLVGSWSNDGYPSALVRFLLCLGVEPVICPPRRPDLKPFVERCIRTLKKHPTQYPNDQRRVSGNRYRHRPKTSPLR